mmetsp:Transcript_97241/g.243786  ORF Transcript_97241/g.243786 Transcript_97241/m.243786 type:complete len:203 (-) Transcript_97241:840-1448(-)
MVSVEAREYLPHCVVLCILLELPQVIHKVGIYNLARPVAPVLRQLREVLARDVSLLEHLEEVLQHQGPGLAVILMLEGLPNAMHSIGRHPEGGGYDRGPLDKLQAPHVIEHRQYRPRRGQRCVERRELDPGIAAVVRPGPGLAIASRLCELHPRQGEQLLCTRAERRILLQAEGNEVLGLCRDGPPNGRRHENEARVVEGQV